MDYIWPLDKVFDGEASMNTSNIDSAHFRENLFSLARAYVLYQKFENIYDPIEALKRGTAFKDLDKPEYRKKY